MVSRIESSTNAGLAPATLYDYSTYTGINERRLVDRLPPPSPLMMYLYHSNAPPHHLHVPIVLKRGSLKLLEPSWPVQGLIYLYL